MALFWFCTAGTLWNFGCFLRFSSLFSLYRIFCVISSPSGEFCQFAVFAGRFSTFLDKERGRRWKISRGRVFAKRKIPANTGLAGIAYGADNQIRTGDLVLTKDVLCLLSHISICRPSGQLLYYIRPYGVCQYLFSKKFGYFVSGSRFPAASASAICSKSSH